MSSQLPPLAIGSSFGHEFRDLRAAHDAFGAVCTPLSDIEPSHVGQAFKMRIAHVQAGQTLLATASLGLRIQAQSVADLWFALPVQGEFQVQIDGRRLPGRASEVAHFVCGEAHRAWCDEAYAGIGFHVDRARLVRTAAAMAGRDADALPDLRLDHNAALLLRQGAHNLWPYFLQAFKMADALSTEPTASLLQIDDTLYRGLAALLMPSLLNESGPRRVPDRSALENTCAWATACLDQPISLTDLEQVSGLSRRSLQYAFAKRFGCSPMQWIRQQRLQRARERLMDPTLSPRVTVIALECGFTHLGEFAAAYQRRYGETPSQTLARRLR